MAALRRSELDQLHEPDAFVWSTGIEDTFITAPHPRTGRTLDEYELTGHYEQWHADIALMRDLGVRYVRYGVPWHRINPLRNTWDWTWTDRALERLLELDVNPIVDLVHYGLPSWIEGAFLHPDFDRYMAEYAFRLAERFKGRIRWYTPLNEPRITAWYCGKLGWWPPFRRGWSGFAEVMVAVCRGMVQTERALHAVDPEIVDVYADATDLYDAADVADADEAEHRQQLVFLALDLVSGRVNAGHPLHGWLRARGISENALEWFLENGVDLDVIGINLYPMFSRKLLVRSRHGLRTRMSYASAEIVERLGGMYYERYKRPLMISETASVGSVAKRRAWLEDSVAAVRTSRTAGIPMVGYTWWPLFALVTWGYRQGNKAPADYIRQMGLWDLDVKDERTLTRVATPLVERYRNLVSGGSNEVGRLTMSTSMQMRSPHPGVVTV